MQVEIAQCGALSSDSVSDQKTSAYPLPGDDWEVRFTKTIVRSIAHYKTAAGLTTRDLAAACGVAAGDPDYLKPTTLNNLLAGKRRSIGVAELLVFAQALEVPPLALLVPLGVEDTVEYWPNHSMSTADAVHLLTSSPWEMLGSDIEDAAPGRAAVILRLLRQHDAADAALADQVWQVGAQILEGEQAPALLEAGLRGVQASWRLLKGFRTSLRERNVTPRGLGPLTAWVDSLDSSAVDLHTIRALVEPLRSGERGAHG